MRMRRIVMWPVSSTVSFHITSQKSHPLSGKSNWIRKSVSIVSTNFVRKIFLGAFAKLWKKNGYKLRHVCPSVHMELGSRWKDFHEIWSDYFWKKNLSRKFKFHSNLTTVTGTVHADRYTLLLISRSVLLRMRNVSNKICRGNQTYILCSVTVFFSKIVPFRCEKILQSGAGHRWQYGKFALHAGYGGYTHTNNTHIACWIWRLHTH